MVKSLKSWKWAFHRKKRLYRSFVSVPVCRDFLGKSAVDKSLLDPFDPFDSSTTPEVDFWAPLISIFDSIAL